LPAGLAGRFGSTRQSKGNSIPTVPYQYTRNPQLVGLSTVLFGVLFVVDSIYPAVGIVPVLVWIALLPIAEEPWLEEQFGDEYEAYRREVPRFVGLRSITNVFGYSQ